MVTAQATMSDGIHIYNPNDAYGPVPSCVEAWIPQGCTDQGMTFDATGEQVTWAALPWVPRFQAANDEPQSNGMGVQTLRCGKSWRFLAWDDDSSHSYHEVSQPGKTDCPQGLTRETEASVLVHDPYNKPLIAVLEERQVGSEWVASHVDVFDVEQGPDLYPPHCPLDN